MKNEKRTPVNSQGKIHFCHIYRRVSQNPKVRKKFENNKAHFFPIQSFKNLETSPLIFKY